MPNWCENQLSIEGPQHTIATIVQKCGIDKGTFDFNGVVPMPAELDIPSSSSIDFGREALYGDWEKVLAFDWVRKRIADTTGAIPASREDFLTAITRAGLTEMIDLENGRKAQSNLDRFGYADWYDWCIANWGTKWNAYSVEINELSERRIKLSFETAWTPPVPVIAKLCSTFPDVEVCMHYFESGCWFAGTVEGSNGEIADFEAEDVSAFAQEYFGFSPDD